MKERSAAFAVGAAGYPCLEILARGHSHWSMAVLGGVCVMALVWIARHCAGLPLVAQAALGAAFITASEFAVGLVVNLALGWEVWDYSREFANVLGQICPLFSFFWFLLCLPVLGALRYRQRRDKARPAATGAPRRAACRRRAKAPGAQAAAPLPPARGGRMDTGAQNT